MTRWKIAKLKKYNKDLKYLYEYLRSKYSAKEIDESAMLNLEQAANEMSYNYILILKKRYKRWKNYLKLNQKKK